MSSMNEEKEDLLSNDSEECVNELGENMPVDGEVENSSSEDQPQSESISSDLDHDNIVSMLSEQKESLSNIRLLIEKLVGQIEDSDRKEKIIQNMHAELQSYSRGFGQELLSPILMHLISLHDITCKALVKYREDNPSTGDATATEMNLISIKKGIEGVLFDYNIEPIIPCVGDKFDPKVCKPIDIVITDEEQKDGTVAKVFNLGFRNTNNMIVLKYPVVEVYSYKKNIIND